MTDDPFLAPPPQPGQPVQPTPANAPAPYQPPPYVQPTYAQPGQAQPGYASYPPPPMAYPGQSKPKTWMNWVAFGCGLGALFTCGASFLPAIIFGHLGLAAANRGEADAKGPGIAGLVLGYVFAVVAIAYVFLLFSL